jgi:hypothetical protein
LRIGGDARQRGESGGNIGSKKRSSAEDGVVSDLTRHDAVVSSADRTADDAMKINLYGQVGNTKLTSSQGLLPLFEAVINSIEAIEDRTGGVPPD